MSLSTNTTYRLLVEKLGATEATSFVGNEGEVFYDPSVATLKLSDGSTSGGVTIGGGGGGGESYWESTGAGINTSSNVGLGTTNPTVKLQVGSVLDPQVIGFGTVQVQGQNRLSTNILLGDAETGSSLTPIVDGAFARRGLNNNFIGAGAGKSTTTGNYNNFFGLRAGYYNTTGRHNNFLGEYAGYNTTGDYNNFFGHRAGYNSTGGDDNNFFGKYVGQYNTTGSYNNFFGAYAGGYNTTGDNNNFIGHRAGYSNTTGSYNNFFGREAGYSSTGGSYNNFIGYYAGGGYNTTGSYNNFFGVGAGEYNTTGSYNIFIGEYAGKYNTTGSDNISIGRHAGRNNTTGSYNNFFGSFTGISTSASNKVILGRGFSTALLFDSPNTTSDTQLAIGIRTGPSPSNYWIVGDENFNIGIGTTNPTKKLHVGGDAKVGVNTSQGVVLTSPDGTEYRLVVANDGTLTTTLV